MNVILTGSRAYGTPRGGRNPSDVDLVILTDPDTLAVLRDAADSDDSGRAGESDAGPQQDRQASASLRFGGLNLLCITDPLAYEVWAKGTRMLRAHADQRGPVDRDLAKDFFAALRAHHGLTLPHPRPGEPARKPRTAADPDDDIPF